MRKLIGMLALAFPGIAFCADRFIDIDTRPGVRVGYWWMERPDATATLVLLPGGKGGIGLKDGVPASANFLVRNRDRFAAAKFNVAVVGRPSDRQDLTLAFRTSLDHVEDLRRVVDRLKREAGKPVWLVGTSRGTTSAAAGGAALGKAIDGVVLTSSITDASLPGAVQNLPLAQLRVPVLVMHHRRDGCRATSPDGIPAIVQALVNAPARRLALVNGGSGARGDACEALHWHGFIGMDQEAVDEIADFIRNPKPELPAT